MESRDIIVLSPSGAADPSLAIAACRAGACGVLDLEFATRAAAEPALAKLAKFATGFGVQLRADAADLFDLVAGFKPAVVILAGADSPALISRINDLKRQNVAVLREAVSVAEAARAVELGAAGVVLKGHEAGGRVGADTSFVLIQKWRHRSEKSGTDIPFWVRGGAGTHTAAACLAGGARGLVLDSQVLLTRESAVSDGLRKRIGGLDGGEALVLGSRLGEAYRIYARPDCAGAQELAKDDERLQHAALSAEEKLTAWRDAVRARVAADPADGVWLVGQDVVTAAPLAAKGVTVAGVVQLLCERAGKALESAKRLGHLRPDAPLAKAHGTKYPILQGPMTRVSDTAAFAASVAGGGALPFLALALLRKAETEKLLAETKAKLGNRPWGVGILGFAPNEIRAEQLEAIRAYKPPFAIIAGGRPDQARQLEAMGTPTYLHVPAPGLLKMFLKDGAKRFIFEGQECGGHIGPRTSFALWEAMVEVLLEHIGMRPADDLHVVFAGGIHDARSASMVAALSAPLAEKGVKVGVLLGTAYLFTEEAVKGGAITARFQKEALACGDTVLLETGPGHAIRCIPTPYADTFEVEKRKLRAEGKSPLEVGIALERMNLGRLRVASKGVDRAASVNGNGSGLADVSGDDQFQRGMYMIGQVAALWDRVTTIPELHANVCDSVVLPESALSSLHIEPEAPPPCDVAIVGLSCFYPGSTSLWGYWENILAKTNAVIEIPPSHWDWRPYYDPDPRARDKMVSKWGGFMSDITFDPLKYGITPKSIPNIEPLQLLLLEAVNQALGDAGYLERPFSRERTCAILGVGGGGMPLSVAYGFRACMPLLDSIPGVPVKSQQIVDLGEGMLPEWTEDSFPGILLNVAAGRVANRFNLGGPNMAIDAACGSSLAALYAGVRELQDNTSDVAIVMGGDAVQTPYAYVAFSKTHALSPKGRCRPFDADADGIALAEGVGVAVLKRLADAERDGDRIYAVIKGVGASSDGRDKGLTAPRAEGQLRALHRAYAQARVNPSKVALVEAHGTGTVVGDQTEARAIGQLMRDAGGAAQTCAIGSVKSMIGHSKCAAGLAGLIKTAFALHHKVLPPTQVEKPNPKANLDGGPLYLNTEAKPWVHGADHPRTAGVSAFGFGGTNFHTVLEEYTGDFLNRPETGLRQWPAELFVWRRADKAAVLDSVKKVRDALAAGAQPTPADLAASVWHSSKSAAAGAPVLAVVATSLADLKDKLGTALEALPKATDAHTDPRGVYFSAKPAAGKVAFLFPGQGSQYPDMLAQVAMAFGEVREVLDRAEGTLAGDLDRPLGKLIYPPSPFTPEQDAANRDALRRTEVAQSSIGATSLGMYRLLSALGVEADMFAGHSYGEYTALAAAGALPEDDLMRLSFKRGRAIREAAATAPGGMIAADTTAEAIEPVLKGLPEVWIANHNSPTQTVIAGTEAGVKRAAEKLQAAGIRSQRIAVACGFHSPLIAGAKPPLAEALGQAKFGAPKKPVFSNTSAAPHPADGAAIAAQLAEHLVSPVRFADEVRAMHAAGARVFVEVGPQAVLTGLTGQILAGKPHVALATDAKSRPGLVQLAHVLGQLLTAGVGANLDRLFVGRAVQPFDLAKLSADTGKPKHPATAWVVNGVRSRPINGPEPRLLGQALPAGAAAAAAAKPAPAAAQSAPAPAPSVPAAPAHGAPRGSAETKAAKSTPPAPQVNAPARSPVQTTSAPAAAPVRGAPAPRSPGTAAPFPSTAAVTTPSRAMMHNTDTPPALPVPSANGNGYAHASTPAPDGAAAVMMHFQDVMAKFLDTQKSVMLGFLGAPAAAPAPAAPANGHATYAAVPYTNGHAYTNGNGNGNGHAYTNGNGHAATAPRPVAAPVNRVAPQTVARPAAPVVAPAAPANGRNGKHETNGAHAPTPAPAPAPTPAPVVVAEVVAKKPGQVLDRDALLAQLLELVSERTGYPKEALSIDLDLEADLGVDSIKRVEVLGALAESIEAGADGKQPNLEMEKLSVIKTLRGIADYVMGALNEAAPAAAPSTNGKHEPAALPAAPAAGTSGDLHPGARQGDVQRLVVRLIDAPLPIRPTFKPPTGAIVITDDGQGTARELADRLAELDIKTALVRHGGGDGFTADLTDPDEVSDLLKILRSKVGPVSGLIHLLPLAEPPAGESAEQRMRREVKSLYLLARGLEGDIREAGKGGSAVLLAVTALGGTMGYGRDLPDDFFAGHGGIAGFTKCLGYEWPEVTVRAVDVSADAPAPRLAEQLLGELGDPDGPFEVGRDGEFRKTWQVDPGPLAKETAAIELDANSTVLVTGGARGITAKIALEIATRYKSRLVLVGSSPVPVAEHPDTTPLTAPADLKAALMKLLQAEGKSAAPAAVEQAYKRLLKDREIRQNLDAIRHAGSEVEYRCVDVRDAAAFGALIAGLNATTGITGVIHGAGVIEDKLLRDKTPESFDRVFGTKVDSALTLARKLDPAKLKFFALFASITSRYGNRGQSDYAAANEVLSKLACQLDRKWPGRVVSVAWGPWAEVGMVADLAKHLVARGLKLIEPGVGAGFAVDEFVFGTKGEPEVLVAGGTESAPKPARPSAPGESSPVPTGPNGYPIASGAGG
ncbi:Phenolphthiocerol synthesis polyketide synthase type I Pks15/1 [Gemmata obscuriglobus]|uniref:Polyketide synthase n=1 Tax=Gemmata obscuriglobus TaxID=114 RepID=A0A2Z3GY03_9BACT|nr:type I polyketide synthase [Gemmata obscuriglobus]AWM36377.1 polyketide synthase [Gemmata obscuriglobus]QEG31011.1 Phenolphthiocerol synthesis polyketide synthase type I Pks15/1 [Gemmata obscuriglobus]VTS10346.1 6-deoxyerythronolide-b synthase : Polyketide synthase family protein OS=Singulisphaera acidiphila (strain ATCC BAA-1392 / DSM 18658 / VKM B-2454 / MOB10) GN=Sinac_5564 PE=4 SV=1: NMO: NMO: ketoacyl-synt: Ketoacyl-synt_C: Acyl_transf_1: PP-binding: KR [Gemmata obscuriglobus UQM 2246]